MVKTSLKLPCDVPLYRIVDDDARVLVACHIEATKGQLLMLEQPLEEVTLGLSRRPAYRVTNRTDEVFYILPEDIVPAMRPYVDEWIDIRDRLGDSLHPPYIREPVGEMLAELEQEMSDLLKSHTRPHLRAAS